MTLLGVGSLKRQPYQSFILAPSNLTATAMSNSQINLIWKDISTNETGFKVFMNTINSKPVSAKATTGANVISYNVTGLIANTIYYFWVQATNASTTSTAISTNAKTLLSVSAPVITVHPKNQSSPVNGTATFTVTATGTGLSYQWQKNNTNIAVETSASYTPPALTVNDIVGAATYRCIIKNSGGTVTSNGATLSISTVKDADANVYNQVKIGTQIWTIENLRVTKYSDKTPIPKVTSSTTWASATTPMYCYYNNTTNSESIKKFGALYNWYVVNPANPKKIAPTGWHVPTDAEWTTLEKYLIANGYNWDNTTTGNKIGKSLAAKTDWNLSATVGTVGNNLTINNRSGFSALPGGYRYSDDSFDFLNHDAYWWSSTTYSSNNWSRDLYNLSEDLFRNYYHQTTGFSVRLIKN